MQAAVMGPVQTFAKTASINQRPLAEELAEALGPHRVVMLRSHGAVTVGAGSVVVAPLIDTAIAIAVSRNAELSSSLSTSSDDPTE